MFLNISFNDPIAKVETTAAIGMEDLFCSLASQAKIQLLYIQINCLAIGL